MNPAKSLEAVLAGIVDPVLLTADGNLRLSNRAAVDPLGDRTQVGRIFELFAMSGDARELCAARPDHTMRIVKLWGGDCSRMGEVDR